MFKPALVLSLSLTLLACAPSPEDLVRKRAEAFMQALLWRDVNTLYTLHADSQGLSPFCDDRGRALFIKTEQRRTPELCAEAKQVVQANAKTRAALDEHLLVVSDILHFQCQFPEQPCAAFSRDLFFRKASRSPLFLEKVDKISISRVHLDTSAQPPARASVYLEVIQPGNSTPRRVTLDLIFHNNTWWVSTYPW